MQICMLLVDTLDVESVESIIMCAVWTLTCVYMVLFLTPVCMHACMVVKSEGLSFLCMWIGACSLPFIFVSLAVASEECAFFNCEGWHIDWSRLCECKSCKKFTHPHTCMDQWQWCIVVWLQTRYTITNAIKIFNYLYWKPRFNVRVEHWSTLINMLIEKLREH